MSAGHDYVFTVSAGRSGQGALCALLRRHVPGCYAAFEEPHADPVLPSVLGVAEKRFRRRFIQTHELLGRGKVLSAFAQGDEAYLDRIAARRLKMIDRVIHRTGCTIHVDVSKYFARGLHRAFLRARPESGLILLVRDPLLNMKSFLNRNKNFRLDNSPPDAPGNVLQMNSDGMAKGEVYLWAWCEMYLRYHRLIEEFAIARHIEIRTECLNDPARMAGALDALGLAHGPVEAPPRVNTNVGTGLAETRVDAGDVELFARFLSRLPGETRARIGYFDDYDPTVHLRRAAE